MSTFTSRLSDILFGQIRGSVLALLYGSADKAFYLRQIARHVQGSTGAVRRELEKLVAVDLIVRKSIGTHVFYQVNQRNPVFAEMRALVNKTVGIFSILRSALDPVAGRIGLVFIYGSVARQEEQAGSDIDLMIIGDIALDDILSCLPDAEKKVGRTVNPTVYSTQEFRAKFKAGNHFLNAVVRGPKVFLIGNEDELGTMAGIRVVKAGAQQRKRNQSIAGHHRAKLG